MFKGVAVRDTVAPYTRGMSTQRWIDEVPLEAVRLDDLWVTQESVYFAALIHPNTPVGGDLLPHIVAVNGELYIEDGHTRLVRAGFAGKTSAVARVLRTER